MNELPQKGVSQGSIRELDRKIELEWASLNTECQQHKVKMHFDNWLAFF